MMYVYRNRNKSINVSSLITISAIAPIIKFILPKLGSIGNCRLSFLIYYFGREAAIWLR